MKSVSHPPQPPHPRFSRAFSLVELAIAVGLASFALIALLGLMTVGFQAGGSAKVETVISAMAPCVISKLQGQPYGALANGTFYFDAQGNEVPSQAEAAYRCITSVSPVTSVSGVQSNLTSVVLTFEWPVTAATPQKATLQASVARYE